MKTGALMALRFVLPALVLVACTAESPEKSIASAKEYLRKNELEAAIIETKNALQKNPDLAEARYLLGSSLLKAGNVIAAEVELRKALAANHPADVVVPDLTRSMVAQGQSKKVVDEFGNTQLGSAAANAGLQTSLASAYAALGQPERAEAALGAALSSDPNHAPALLIRARQKVAARDFGGALEVVEGVLARSPQTTGAWMLKGDILIYAMNKPDEALAAYRQALEVDPKYVPAHVAIVPVLIFQGSLDAAGKQIEQLSQLAPKNPQAKYFEAQLANQRKDLKSARESIRQSLQLAPNNPRALLLAGAVELQLGATTQAEVYLSKAVQIAPELAAGRRLLIVTYLRSGQPARALAELGSVAGKQGLGPEWYALAGEVYLRNGDAKKAEDYFVKALKFAPENTRTRRALAAAHLAGGKPDLAVSELEDLAASEKSVTAELALVSVHLQQREFAKALEAVERVESKLPGRPLAAELRGRVQLAQGDGAAARRSFERALSIDPGYFAAAASLAALDLADKKPADAKKRYESFLVKNPKSGQALVALARLAAGRNADKEEVAALLTKAIEADPTDHEPHLLLIELFLRAGDNKQALQAAQSAVAALPNHPLLVDALGRVQQASGAANQAIVTYGRLVALQPLSTLPYVRLANAYAAEKNYQAAEQSLRKALQIRPDDLEAQRGLFALALQTKRYQDALGVARTVQKQPDGAAVGFDMEGDVAAARREWGAATAAYRTALQRGAGTDVAIKLHLVLLASGKSAETSRFAATWLKEHPKDGAFLFHLGNQAISRRDYAAAERYYLSVLQIQPNNAMTLNILAWVTHQLGKGGAVAYAEKATSLAPSQPAFLDTLAMLLADQKKYDKAIELQRRALELEPENATVRLHLAKIYIQAGDKDKARNELETLAQLGEKFHAQGEVAALLKAM